MNADVRLNNYEVDPRNVEVRKQIAFVAQDDSLQVTATPREINHGQRMSFQDFRRHRRVQLVHEPDVCDAREWNK